jgi:predicted alpha/beta hydrolase family esterase
MTNVIIIHGAYGHPEENWIPWLKIELEKLNCHVTVPRFPTPEGQTLANWLNVFDEYKLLLDKDSLVVGHSLGPALLLTVLERLNSPIRAAFFVSGFIGLLDNPDFDNINKSFVDKEFVWKKIKQNCQKFYIFHSDSDPYVPLSQGRDLTKKLNGELIIIKNGGHLNEQAGFKKFDLLLNKINKEL